MVSKQSDVTIRFFHYIVLIYKKSSRTILQKRTGNDIWKELYEFPVIESNKFLSKRRLHSEIETTLLIGNNSCRILQTSKEYSHQLSHQKIFARFYVVENEPAEWNLQNKTIVSYNDLVKYPVSRLKTG